MDGQSSSGNSFPSVLSKRNLLFLALGFIMIELSILGVRKSPLNTTNGDSSADDLECHNILTNLTKGIWVRKIELLPDIDSDEHQRLATLENFVDQQLSKFRLLAGIQSKTWRDDGKCGFSNLQVQPPGSHWDRVGSWCNANSSTPCCSDVTNGRCVSYDSGKCDCEGCVDMRRIIHADVADWVPADARCRPRSFIGIEACKAVSKFNEVYLVGDSLMRKFYAAFVMTIKSDFERGAFVKTLTAAQKKRCVGNDQFYYAECRDTGFELDDFLDKTSLCEGRMPVPFNVSNKVFFSQDQSGHFLNLAKSLAGKEGSLIVVGVGLHFDCNSNAVIGRYLGPAVNFLEAFHRRQANGSVTYNPWPKMIFVPPDRPGLLKPPAYHSRNGAEPCGIYTEEMKKYCKKHDIPLLSFDDLTKNVHTYDGTHYGRAVNLMKVQFLLNYIHDLKI